jgi:hypothetical protein
MIGRLARCAAGVSSLVVAAGCFDARTRQPLAVPSSAAAPAQVLPVLPGSVRIGVARAGGEVAVATGSGTDHEEVAKVCNAVLEDLLRGGRSSLRAPSRMGQASAAEWSERLRLYLDEPGTPEEDWKTQGMREMAAALGVPWLVDVRVSVRQELPADLVRDPEFLVHAEWSGTVRIEARLIEIESRRLAVSSGGDGSFHGKAGVVVSGGYGGGIAIPYAFGKGFPPAVEAALRRALSGLEAARLGAARP